MALTGLLTLAIAGSANALTLKEARSAAREAVVQSFAGFTENKPRTRTRCLLTDSRRARCKVRYRGDRLKAQVKVSVREDSDGYYVRLYNLKLK